MSGNAICLHAWAFTLDGENSPTGDQEYCDPAERTPDGWCVYTRVDVDSPDADPSWDIEGEADFDNLEDAMREAIRRSGETGFPVQEY